MRILLGTPSYSPCIRGGGEISTQLLASGLSRAGVDVQVLTAFREGRQEQVDGIPVQRVKSANTYWSFDSRSQPPWRRAVWHLREAFDPSLARPFEAALTQFRPDILHTSGIEDLSPGIWQMARRHGIPVVHTLRSYTLICSSASLFRNGRNCEDLCAHCRVLSFPKKRQSTAVDVVIGISDYVLQRHLSLGFFARATAYVVPNIAEDGAMDAAGDSGSARPARAEGLPVLGFLGRLSAEKGIEALLQALALIEPKRRPPLLIGGWGDPAYEAKLRALAGNGNVEFMGRVRPRALLDRADVLVVPSLWHEPLGRTVLEGISCGVPVLGASRGGIPEMILPGVNGWLFDPEDLPEFAKTLERIVADVPALRRVQSTCKQTETRYAMQTIVTHHLSIYETLLSAPSARHVAAGESI